MKHFVSVMMNKKMKKEADYKPNISVKNFGNRKNSGLLKNRLNGYCET